MKREEKNVDKNSRSASILEFLIENYTSPSFGHLPKREIDLLMLEAMVQMGEISPDPSIDDLIGRLHIPRSKARSLIYDRDLRRLSVSMLDEKLKISLRNPLIQKQGELYVVEVENQRLQDHIRSILRSKQHLADGSFASGMMRLNAKALCTLLEYSIADKERVKEALVAAGAPDHSLGGVIRGALVALGHKLASEAGEGVAASAGEYIGPLIDGTTKKILSSWRDIFD